MSTWTESEFNTYDGLTLFYRYRRPKSETKKTLIFLHRGHEHSARIMPFADKLSEKDYWCFSFDLRGHGLSQGPRAWAPNFESWVKDLNSFIGHVNQIFGVKTKDTVIVANSVGSVMAVSWILNYGANLKGCILGAPAFSIKLYIPLALPFLKLVSRFSEQLFVTSYVRSNLLTRDESEAESYDKDPLITKKIGVNVLVSLFDACKNIFKRLKDFEVPVLIFTAGKDYIVDNKMHSVFYNGVSSSIKKHVVLEDFRHAIFHEKEQQKIIDPAKEFLTKLFDTNDRKLPAIIPQPREHTIIEYQQLEKNTSKPVQIYYGVYRYLLENIGKFSKGVSIGLKYGFDSGVSLDYVYKNRVSGTHLLGKIIDYVYLNSVGWRGIRVRKQNLKNTIKAIINNLNKNGIEPVIFDIASGPGRYLFEIQNELSFPIHLYLNDIDNNSLEQAKSIASELSADNTKFTNQNVFELFDPDNFSRKPNIIIISGLFELYENNHLAHQVISNLHKLLVPGGYIIYTGQPWHPQIKLIGRILNNRNGKRWIMRRRIQSEMDELIESAGFDKLSTMSDDLGIFTVSCAHKC